ncbi:MAG: hypothetical protein R6W90_00945 [Ignavibacteriaceae bacterium]
MFTKNHYINWISLISTGLINSLFICTVLVSSSFLLPVVYFIAFISLILITEKKLKPVKENQIRILIASLSPALYYLLLVEYGILINILLMIFLIFLSERYLHKTVINFTSLIFAFLFGVLLSADSSMFIIYIIYILYSFRTGFMRIFIFTGATTAVYVLLLLTYSNLNSNIAEPANPLEIRSFLSFIPIWGTILIFLLSIYIGWMVSDFQEMFFAGGLMLLIPTLILLITGIINLKEYNIYNTVLYMSAVSIPFFILAIRKYKVDRFLGKY